MKKSNLNICGVYRLSFSSNPSQFYIGSSRNLRIRFNEHKTLLRCQSHPNKALQSLFDKHSDIVMDLIEECPVTDLIDREAYFISVYQPPLNIVKRGSKRNHSVTIHRRGDHQQSKRVYCYNGLDLVKEYESLSAVADDGYTIQNVHRAIKKKMKHKKLTWTYERIRQTNNNY
jgi:group I intron endonuclease